MRKTTFEAIYDITRRIPRGCVATYGQVAMLAGIPRGARIVGYAMASCPHADVPCHRVVDRFGRTKAAFDVFTGGVQRAMLEEESVEFDANGRVDLGRFLWQPERIETFLP